MSGGMGLFSAGMGFGGLPSPLKGRGNCSSRGYHPELGHHLGEGASHLGGMGISLDGSVMSSGGLGGVSAGSG